jgi:hypothetical protein
VSTFVDRGVSRGQRGGSPTVVNLSCTGKFNFFNLLSLFLNNMWEPLTNQFSFILVSYGDLSANQRCAQQSQLQLDRARLADNIRNGHPEFTSVRDLHVAFQIPYVYDYITKLCRQQAEVIQNYDNENVRNI